MVSERAKWGEETHPQYGQHYSMAALIGKGGQGTTLYFLNVMQCDHLPHAAITIPFFMNQKKSFHPKDVFVKIHPKDVFCANNNVS